MKHLISKHSVKGDRNSSLLSGARHVVNKMCESDPRRLPMKKFNSLMEAPPDMIPFTFQERFPWNIFQLYLLFFFKILKILFLKIKLLFLINEGKSNFKNVVRILLTVT